MVMPEAIWRLTCQMRVTERVRGGGGRDLARVTEGRRLGAVANGNGVDRRFRREEDGKKRRSAAINKFEIFVKVSGGLAGAGPLPGGGGQHGDGGRARGHRI